MTKKLADPLRPLVIFKSFFCFFNACVEFLLDNNTIYGGLQYHISRIGVGFIASPLFCCLSLLLGSFLLFHNSSFLPIHSATSTKSRGLIDSARKLFAKRNYDQLKVNFIPCFVYFSMWMCYTGQCNSHRLFSLFASYSLIFSLSLHFLLNIHTYTGSSARCGSGLQ